MHIQRFGEIHIQRFGEMHSSKLQALEKHLLAKVSHYPKSGCPGGIGWFRDSIAESDSEDKDQRNSLFH